jgi:putative ABC transport system permease protein
MLRDFSRDLVYAGRTLSASPAFTTIALLTIALGIGANTAIFSVLNAVLLRPLPYRDADRLVFLWTATAGSDRAALTPARLVDFRDRLTTVEHLEGIGHLSVNLTGASGAERVPASSVSSGFFDLLGVAPLVGDTFHKNSADPNDVVLSHGLWMRRLGGDRGLVGGEIVVNGRARRIAAVMPPEFAWPSIIGRGASSVAPPQLWMPGAGHDIPRTPGDDPGEDLSGNRGIGFLRAVGRLQPGTTLAQAQREADAVAARLAAEHPREDGGTGAAVQPMREQFFGIVRSPLVILSAAAACVLAIACANAASLLLGRATLRRREIAVRLALGAARGRIVRQLLAESLVLAGVGAIGGLAIAALGRRWLVALAPSEIPRLAEAGLDPMVLAFTAAVSILTGTAFGLVPAWHATAGAVTADLRDADARGTSGPRTGRLRDGLVAAQIAIALVLLVGAGLLVRSLTTLTQVDTGIDTRNLITFDMALSGTRASEHARRVAAYSEMLAELAAVPGVRAIGAAATLPIGGDDFSTPFAVEDAPVPAAGNGPSAGYQVVSPGYFDAMGIRVRSGRDVRASDTDSAAPVVLVNETLAAWQWPGQDPIGRRIRLGQNPSSPWRTVVGVVSDVRHRGPASPPRPEIYQPLGQASFTSMAFAVRSAVPAAAIVPALRAAVARRDPRQPISRVSTMDEHITRAVSRPHFMSTLIGSFAVLALLLAVVGIYGVMAYAVAQRTREIAIRCALGARPGDVIRMVLVKACWLGASGVAAGIGASMALTRVLAGQLFGVSPTDPLTYSSVAALLIAVTLLAGAIPAARATRIDPTLAMRS